MVEAIKEICIFVIIAQAVMFFVPGNAYMKYVRILVGILMILKITEPVFGLLLDKEKEKEISEGIAFLEQNIELNAAKLEIKDNRTEIYGSVTEELKNKLNNCESGYKVLNVELTEDQRIVITVAAEETENSSENKIQIDSVVIGESSMRSNKSSEGKEEELKQAFGNSISVDAEKIEVVGHLAASISHEVRNPLTVSRGFMQLLLQSERVNYKDRQYIQIAIEEIDRAEAIITDYLTFAKPAPEHVEKLNVKTEIERVIDILRPLANMSSIEIQAFLLPFAVKGERQKFQQCLLNVMKNAIEAMPNGGTLRINVSIDKDYVLIHISDTGVGMTKEQIELAKKIGYTTDNARSSVQKIEAGKSDPPASRIHNLATALDVPVAVLMGWEEFDKQFDVEKLEAETAMWDFIGKHYGESAVDTLHQYLEFSKKDQEKISKLLSGYSKLDEEDRTILFARAYQILEDMLAAEKYAAQKESRRA